MRTDRPLIAAQAPSQLPAKTANRATTEFMVKSGIPALSREVNGGREQLQLYTD